MAYIGTYEEGSLTPVLEFGGGSTGITYSQQGGQYTRIANIVFFKFFITLTNKGSSTGSAVITGLPFSSVSTASIFSISQYSNLTYLSSRNTVFGSLSGSSTSFGLFMSGDNTGQSALTDTQFANNTIINGSGFYFAES